MRTADVDWQCDLGILYYDDLLEGRLFNIKLYVTVMFMPLFNDADLKVQITYRRMRNDNVIIPEDSKERSVKCFFINVCRNWYLFWYMCINVLLNWEGLTMNEE
jgi:hypothetical protein